MKKILSCILVLATIFALAQSAFAAQPGGNSPQYINAKQAMVSLTISSSGKATVSITLTGNSGLKSTSVTTYLEKKVGSIWTRVDIPAANNEWVYSTTNRSFSKPYSTNLSSTGQYRAVATFTLTGSTVEYITKTSYATY